MPADPQDRYDVAILGGGLAGLTLGLQLKQRRPSTSIFIGEKRKGPAPEAAFKVGESTVELSAHYFSEVLGLEDHLVAEQLPKAGLRYFFTAGDNSDISRRVEWGATALPPVPSFQLDRGRFENELGARNVAAGNALFDDCTIGEVELRDEGDHKVTYSRAGEDGALSARWVVDASGYAGILKRKLGLAKDVAHTVNSCWFRIADGVDLESWVDDEEWLGRMEERGIRKLSTNHLMGEGYWVWLIPLASGYHSIGIVADPRFHPFEQMSSLDAAVEWLKAHERQLGEEIERRRAQVEDFLKVEDFAYSCTRVFSPDRWALTGVAGVFADPFYSPGSDFIAQGNTFITELVDRELEGEQVNRLAAGFNAAYLTAFETLLGAVYTDHYKVFGNAEVMSAKVLWEFALYWAHAALPFFHDKLTDLDFAKEVRGDLRRVVNASGPLEQVFRDWHELSQREFRDVFLSNRAYDAFYQLHLDLHAGFDDEALKRRYRENGELLEAVAVVIFAQAVASVGGPALEEDVQIDPSKLTLDFGSWESNGLLGRKGPTLGEARARTRGIESTMLAEIAEPV